MGDTAGLQKEIGAISTFADLAPIKKMIRSCIQCGTCTASCPNEFAMDFTPRRLWRMVLMDQAEDIFESKTFVLCSSCYFCTLRCPRGLPLTEAMSALKQIACREKLSKFKESVDFYSCFIESVRRHGRVNEAEFMTRYFMRLKNPLTPLRFAPLGMRLILKGKISMLPPMKQARPLESIFRRVEALEEKR
jgi:heterodisulfide reductase subunit C